MLQVYAQETTFVDKKYDYCRLQLMVHRHFEHRNYGFSFQSEKSTRGQTCNGSSDQRKHKRKRQSKCQQPLRERRLRPLAHKRPMFNWRSMRSSMTRTRKSKGRPRSPSPTGSLHRNSTGEGKGSTDGSAKGTPKFNGKSPSGKANRLPCTKLPEGNLM